MTHQTLARGAMAAALCGAFATTAITLPVPAAAQTIAAVERAYNVNLRPQTLATALTELSSQTGVQLYADGALLAGINAPAVHGTLTVRDALQLLLKGTGLGYRAQGEDSFLIQRGNSDANAVLPAVTVMAEAEADATSEGTGSYAARAASLFKGAQSLKEIPQSITVMTREQMNDQGITRLDEAYNYLPGVHIGGYANMTAISVRGFGASKQIDGVPMQLVYDASGYDFDPAIYDRVEFLRGPSGLLSGVGEPGGVVNLVRKRPLYEYGLSANLSYGSWNNVRTEWDIFGKLNQSGSLRGRAVTVLQDKDEFYDAAHERRKLAFGTLEYDITGRDTVGIAVTRQETTGNDFWGVPRYTDGSLPKRSAFVGVTDVPAQRDMTEVAADYQHRFDNGWTAKAAAMHRKYQAKWSALMQNTATDLASGLVTDALVVNLDAEYKFNSIDVHFSGPFELLGRQHQATFGFNRGEAELEDLYRLNTTIASLNPITDHALGASNGPWVRNGRADRVKQSGAYGSVNLKLLDPLSLIVGGRVTDYEVQARDSLTAPWVVGDAKADQEFTPYAGLVHELNKQLSVYGSYAEIFVPQSERDVSNRMLKPRTGKQFEIGIKAATLDNKLNASLALYQMRDENRAIRDTDPTHICVGTYDNTCYRGAGKIQSRGLDAEVSGTPVAGWNISGNYTFSRNVYLTDPDPANVGKMVDSSSTPKHMFKLYTQYKTGAGLGDWTVGGGVIAQSAGDLTPYRQGGYSVYSAKVGYRISQRTDLSVDIDNLFDKVYLRTLGYAQRSNYYGTPRSLRLTLKHRFN